MILMNTNKINYLIYNGDLQIQPLPIFSEIVCEFLDELSHVLRTDADAKQYPDVMTFAFWCRRGNLTKLRESYQNSKTRIGRGLIFHIAPSNVPINFAFSLVFGMLAGNGNVVRVSEKEFPQVQIVCDAMNRLFLNPEYEIIARQTQVVSYGHDQEQNDYYSSLCNVRVIWGGDHTIASVRRSPLPPRSTEVTFADRYSFGIFNEDYIDGLPGDALMRLAEQFYNDTYLMDQNACSSPHLILWTRELNGTSSGREKFWNAVYMTARKYALEEKKVVDKFTLLCEQTAEGLDAKRIRQYSNLLYVTELNTLPESIEHLRGKFGMFYEYQLTHFGEIYDNISEKVQTCVTCGMDNEALAQSFVTNYVKGIDRIVPVGEAMDIGLDWDGYDLIGTLSRQIIVHE